MTHKSALRDLPDGSLTREEVNAMIDVIEAWDADFPWEHFDHEMAVEGEFQCYACGAVLRINYDKSDPQWYEARPEAEDGHSEKCPWMKTREWERAVEQPASPLDVERLTRAIDEAFNVMDDEWMTDEMAEIVAAEYARLGSAPSRSEPE